VVINDCFSGIDDVREVANDTDNDDDDIPTDIYDVVDADLPVEYKCDTANLLIEQKRDTSLQQAWTLAAQNKNGYHLSNGLLHHQDSILGQKVNRLVLPIDRRPTVISLAHDTSHVSAKRTRQRLQPIFHWPTIRRDVNDHCLSCVKCQLRRRKTYLERTPIRAI